MAKTIEEKYGHWKLAGPLKELLIECRAEEDSRYAITGICITKEALVATDGRRIVEVLTDHKIPAGNYFCTQDGYMLSMEDEKWPKYKDIIPDEDELNKIVEVDGEGDDIIGLILGELCRAGCICKLSLYQRPAELLSKAINGKVSVYVHKEGPAERLFMIKAETSIGNIIYIQMPVNVENKV